MKDGIYRVTLTIDGQPVVAEARVRNGVLQGLGALAGLIGVISTGDATPHASSTAVPDAGAHQDLAWQRRDLAEMAEAPHVLDANVLPSDLHRVHEELEAIRRDALPRSL